MAGIFDFLNNTAPMIDDAVTDRRLQDWTKSTTQAGDDAMKNRLRGVDLAESRANQAGAYTREAQAAQRATALNAEAWGRSGAAATAGEAAGTVGRGLMGAVKAATGVGPMAMLHSPDVEAAELSPEQREAKNPGEQADAQAYAQRVQQNTLQAASGLQNPQSQMGNQPVSLLDPNADQDDPREAAAAAQALQDNEAPAVIPTPVGEAVQANPVNTQQAEAKTVQDTEVQRQQLEQGALKGLSTGAVSRPKMAEAVVEADTTRSGTQLTPEAKQKAVTAELTNMKSMDNNDLSKYISYALIAGGALAVLMDKSGRAGDAFSASFNRQLDRNLTAGVQNQKNAQAQAKLNQELQIAGAKLKQGDRGLDIKDKSVNQTGIYQQGQIKIGEGNLGVNQDRADTARFAAQSSASQGAQGLGLRAQALKMRGDELQYQHGQDDVNNSLNLRKVAQGDTRNAITAARVAQTKVQPGVALTEKGAGAVVKDFADAQGVKLDGNAKTAFASQVQQASKSDPEWKTDPAKVMNKLLNAGGYSAENDPGIPFVPFTGGVKIKQKKQ